MLPAHSPSLLPHPPGYANQELSPTQSPSSASSGAGPPGRLTCLPLAVIHGLRKKIITLKSQQEVFPVWQPPPVLPPAAAILCQAPGRPTPQPASPPPGLRHPLPASPACRRHLPACIFPGEGPELGVWRARLPSFDIWGRRLHPSEPLTRKMNNNQFPLLGMALINKSHLFKESSQGLARSRYSVNDGD